MIGHILIRRMSSSWLWALMLTSPFVAPAHSQQTSAHPLPYRDARVPVEQRLADLLGRMTLDEKIQQLQGSWQNPSQVHDPKLLFVGPKGEFLPGQAAILLKDGLGEMSRPSESSQTRSRSG
jgi:beta-glucosidase